MAELAERLPMMLEGQSGGLEAVRCRPSRERGGSGRGTTRAQGVGEC